MDRLDLDLIHPWRCDRNVEYYNPHMWFYPRDSNGHPYMTWDLWKLGVEFTDSLVT